MFTLPHVPVQGKPPQNRLALTFKWIACSLLVLLSLGIHQRSQASKKFLAPNQFHALSTSTPPKLVKGYGKLPLSFEANQGQTDARVRFLARGGGYALFLTGDEAVLSLRKPGVAQGGATAARGAGPGPNAVRPYNWHNPFGGETRIHGAARRRSLFGPGALPLPLLPVSLNADSLADIRVEVPHEPSATALRMRLVGANPHAVATGAEDLPGKVNYFIGNDPKKWRTNVPTYARVKYQGVYPGIDLVYYGNQGGQLEYDFAVAPGADAGAIALDVGAGLVPALEGHPRGVPLRIADDGDLIIPTSDGEVRFHKPVAYHEAPGETGNAKLQARHSENRQSTIVNRQLVDARFTLDAENRVRFALGPYDRSEPLVIDPVLVYSTYLGGSGGDTGYAIAVDSSGSAYVAGYTASPDFPTANPLQANLRGSLNAFIAKVNPAGSALAYSTYLGGSGGDEAFAIAVDPSGDAYVAGSTNSSDFPTVNPLQANFGGPSGVGGSAYGDAFVAKLNAAGSALVYSTYLGGSAQDWGNGIAVDSSGSAYVAGSTSSSDFRTANPLQAHLGGVCCGDTNAFVAKLNPAGSALMYATYLGGSVGDQGNAIAVDSSGNAYVTGWTNSPDFPTANPLQAHLGATDAQNAFVAELNAAGSALLYSTYLGGSTYDSGNAIAVDLSGNAYVAGVTQSSNFPTVNPLQGHNGGGYDAFITKLNPAGSALVYSTYLGGGEQDWGYAIAVDSSGNAYVTGYTYSANFPTANPLQASLAGSANGFVTKLNWSGSALSLAYSTYLSGSQGAQGNGIAVDSSANAYQAGSSSTDFPTANPLQASLGGTGASNAFVAKISSSLSLLSPISLIFGSQNVGTTSLPLGETVTNTGTANITVSTVAIGGPNASEFAKSADTCTAATLLPNGTCAVSVAFTPSTTGLRSASMTFTDNAPGVPKR